MPCSQLSQQQAALTGQGTGLAFGVCKVCSAQPSNRKASLLFAAKFFDGKRPWKANTKIDIALPCATQNEVDASDAEALVKAGCKYVMEGANMPSESDAIRVYHKNKIDFGPGKVRPFWLTVDGC